jgi:hypothetical protein
MLSFLQHFKPSSIILYVLVISPHLLSFHLLIPHLIVSLCEESAIAISILSDCLQLSCGNLNRGGCVTWEYTHEWTMSVPVRVHQTSYNSMLH